VRFFLFPPCATKPEQRFSGRYGIPGDAWDHRPSLDSLASHDANRPYSYAPAQGSNLKYSDSAVVDTGSSYAHPEDSAGYVNGEGIREQMVPNRFASEGEYLEYLQDQGDRQHAARYDDPPHHAQGYEHEQQGYETGYAQGYPEQYTDAGVPSSSSSLYPASGPPEYATPPHAQDAGALASGGPTRGDGKYGYVPR
jgi:hypothetical protein